MREMHKNKMCILNLYFPFCSPRLNEPNDYANDNLNILKRQLNTCQERFRAIQISNEISPILCPLCSVRYYNYNANRAHTKDLSFFHLVLSNTNYRTN
jgi:hypothetical protein